MINGKLIKVCGMREPKNIREVETLGIDLMGFIFFKGSPRYVQHIPAFLPSCQRTGVFVDEDINVIKKNIKAFNLDFIQLHGNESPEFCHLLQDSGIKIIKAFSIAEVDDLKNTEAYENYCPYFLFDTKCKQYGGSGYQFNWHILDAYHGRTPFLLSGGIGPKSIVSIRSFHHPLLCGYDLNSCFESAPGVKDINKIREFLNELKNIESYE